MISFVLKSLELFPASSVTVATTSYSCPATKGNNDPETGVSVSVSIDQLPFESGVTLYVAPFTLTLNVSPSSKEAVPFITGVVSSVTTLTTVGTIGDIVSTVIVTGVVWLDSVPTWSVILTLNACSPCPKGVEGSTIALPAATSAAVTTCVPTTTPSSYNVIVSPSTTSTGRLTLNVGIVSYVNYQ